jgi:hypothetical protein
MVMQIRRVTALPETPQLNTIYFVSSGGVTTQYVVGNALPPRLVGVSGGGGVASWGGITGDLEDQTDLQEALDGKLATGAEAATVATINGRIAEGENVTITGEGTAASPYTIAAASGGGSGAISYADAVLTEDVALTANNTWYDGPSVTLAAGTWFIVASGHHRRNATTACNVGIRVWDGAAAVAHGEAYHPSVNGAQLQVPAHGVVVLTETKTMTLQMLTSSGNVAALMKAATQNNSQGNLPTRITALRLA